ncbi:MAG: glycosyltransferase [Alphaproteobacteria bacterium]|nr:glycosyltransferase [Alphaproteobacteria bacterium]
MTTFAHPLSDPEDRQSVNLCDVTVIIPAWNATATLARAVDSAMTQTDVRVQVIIIDDRSTDDTLALARALADSDARVTVLAQSTNRGPAAARNAGMARAGGRFVAPLDSDDFMTPGRMAALVALANDGAWDFVADDLWQINEGEDAQTAPRRRLFSDTAVGVEKIALGGFVRGNMTETHGGRREIGFLKPLMRRSFLEAHNLRYRDDMRLGEDYDFYATALLRGAKFCLTDPKGYIAVVRPGSLSGHHDAAALLALVHADDRLLCDPALTATDAPIVQAHRIETLKRWAWLELIEAVRVKDVRRGVGAFAAPVAVQASLLGKLGEQVLVRSGATITRLMGRSA